jgi:hypothetical protein
MIMDVHNSVTNIQRRVIGHNSASIIDRQVATWRWEELQEIMEPQ